MTADIVDPVAEPSAYQTLLLGALGDRDPADVQAQTPAKVRRLAADAGTHLRKRPKPDEWSVLELIGHIVDAELVVGGRYRWILAHDQPEIFPYDQDLWVSRLHHNEADPAKLISPFEGLRRANLELWRRMPKATRARYGIHRERGPESYELTFKMLAGHDLVHLEQAWRTLDLVRGKPAADHGESR
jgi:hypothetical protein